MPKKRKSRKRNGRGTTLGSDWRTRHLVTDQNPLYVRNERAAEELRAFFASGGVRMIGGDGLFSDIEDHYGYDWRDSVDEAGDPEDETHL